MEFKKLSALTSSDRSKIKNYWNDLWGPKFTTALIADFENEARSIEVKASNKSNKDLRFCNINKIEKVTL